MKISLDTYIDIHYDTKREFAEAAGVAPQYLNRWKDCVAMDGGMWKKIRDLPPLPTNNKPEKISPRFAFSKKPYCAKLICTLITPACFNDDGTIFYYTMRTSCDIADRSSGRVFTLITNFDQTGGNGVVYIYDKASEDDDICYDYVFPFPPRSFYTSDFEFVEGVETAFAASIEERHQEIFTYAQ